MLKSDLLSNNIIWERKLQTLQKKYDKDIVQIISKMSPNLPNKQNLPINNVDDGIILDYIEESEDVEDLNEQGVKKRKWKHLLSRMRRPFRKQR
mmetsp:Transcript_24493/g.23548  ORF Transcript_24493/g.23548 Transcript_24493/m.23548 type:complete len:94 (-) Transcript_24493:18-299(-)